jgi:hypothetical protein
VVVLNAAYLGARVEQVAPESGWTGDQAIYAVAHECGNVQDLEVQDTSTPGITMQKQLSGAAMQATANLRCLERSTLSLLLSGHIAASGNAGIVLALKVVRDLIVEHLRRSRVILLHQVA